MKKLRGTARPSLVIRSDPVVSDDTDTGQRIQPGEVVQGWGESYDHAYTFVVARAGRGWAATRFLAPVTAPAEVGPVGPAHIILRSAWGSMAGKRQQTARMKPGPHELVVAHHFASPDVPATATQEEEERVMRAVEDNHLSKVPKPWAGLAYTHVVFQSGRIYEGRGFGIIGAHTEGRNSTVHGIAFAIDGGRHELTPQAIASFRALVAVGIQQGHVAKDWKLKGHRDFKATLCPGDKVYAQLAHIRGA